MDWMKSDKPKSNIDVSGILSKILKQLDCIEQTKKGDDCG